MLYSCNKVNFIVIFALLLIVMIQVLMLKPTSVIQSNSYFQAFSPSSSYRNPESERKYRRKLNLVEETPEKIEECTLDYINTNKLAQDHPCVLDLIRSQFMNAPVPRNVPYQLEDTSKIEIVNDTKMKHLLKNKRKGFFVECGAFDGQTWSNTLDMEMNFDWTGLLIEGNPQNYKKLISKKRKAWTFPICLSLDPYPTKVLFVDSKDGEGAGSFHIVETDEKGNKKYDQVWDQKEGQVNQGTVEVQCFPFYSVLLASNRTTIDFLSLDVEGHEIKILKTIPWDRVDIKTIRIEWLKIPPRENLPGDKVLTEYMEGEPGYTEFYQVDYDTVFFKDYLNNGRYPQI